MQIRVIAAAIGELSDALLLCTLPVEHSLKRAQQFYCFELYCYYLLFLLFMYDCMFEDSSYGFSCVITRH